MDDDFYFRLRWNSFRSLIWEVAGVGGWFVGIIPISSRHFSFGYIFPKRKHGWEIQKRTVYKNKSWKFRSYRLDLGLAGELCKISLRDRFSNWNFSEVQLCWKVLERSVVQPARASVWGWDWCIPWTCCFLSFHSILILLAIISRLIQCYRYHRNNISQCIHLKIYFTSSRVHTATSNALGRSSNWVGYVFSVQTLFDFSRERFMILINNENSDWTELNGEV